MPQTTPALRHRTSAAIRRAVMLLSVGCPRRPLGYERSMGLRAWWRKQKRFNQQHWLEGLQIGEDGYRATCRCGWVGPPHESRVAAGGDGQDHLTQEGQKMSSGT
jgi:hypothetical protein